MPELPEVETLCRQLNTVLPGLEIGRVRILDPRLGQEAQALEGRRVEAVCRRGKFIRITLAGTGLAAGGAVASDTDRVCGGAKELKGRRGSSLPDAGAREMADAGKPGDRRKRGAGKPAGEPLEALLHLRMTGRLLWCAQESPLPPHTRLALSFASGALLLVDPRRFATLAVQPLCESPPPLPDPLAGIGAEDLRRLAACRRLPVKAFLLDQRLIAGIGNIYACEILHEAGIAPGRPAGALRRAEWARVAAAIRTVIPRAVACRGTSISDWRDLFGLSGTNQDHLQVYGREGRPCRRCGTSVVRQRLNGRGTWFCPACQR